MRAVLIEIDGGLRTPRWYAKHPGLRVWAEPRSCYESKWRLLPGQSIPGITESSHCHVDVGHAWDVREGDVELRLIEIPPNAGDAS